MVSVVFMELRNRPLRDTTADRRRFVDRHTEVDALLRSVSLRFNVLLVGERGAGVSSVLAHLPRAADKSMPDPPSFRLVQTARATTAGEVVAQVAAALDGGQPSPFESEEHALDHLERAARRAGELIVMLDGIDGRLVHAVFGRMRDELWALQDLTWLVGLPADQEALALTPPADQFFESIVRLAPMSTRDIIELLRRRGADGELDAGRLAEIASASAGNPSTALRLARGAVLGRPGERRRPASDVVEEIRNELGEPAARLARELASAGSTGPSDVALLKRLGWSRPRAYEVFRELERHHYVDVGYERSGAPGRPRKMFRLREG
jgi:hypothetical protein